MAGGVSFRAFTGSGGCACDFMPYRRDSTFYRSFAAARPEDWTNNTALTTKADDTRRFVEIAASSRATWLPTVNGNDVEVLARFVMVPGTYTKPTLAGSPNYEVRIDTTAGTALLFVGGSQVASAALPASVWTSSSAFGDCWVRLHVQGGELWLGAKVWSTSEAEPAAYTVIFTQTGIFPAVINTDPPGIGSAAVAAVSACAWFSYGVGAPAPTPRAATDPGYFNRWLANAHAAGSTAPRIVTAELYVQNIAYTQTPLRAATQGYDGGSAWPLDNQPFADALLEFPRLERALPEGVFGRQRITCGDLRIANPVLASGAGLRDDWLRARMQKGTVVLRYGSPAWPWYDLAYLMTGEVTEVSDTPGEIRVAVRDAMARYDRKVARTLFSSGPNSGKPLPICIGEPFNVTPVALDTTALTYQLAASAMQGVTAVRDRGVVLTYVTAANVIAFDAAADTLTTDVAHGRTVGWPVNFSGTLPSPLVAGTVYYVKTVPTSTTLTLAATPGGATIDLTGGGTATIEAAFPTADLLRTTAAHGFAANDPVVFSGSVPAGITAGVTYYVLSSGLASQTFQVSATVGGAAVNITATTLTVSSVVAALDYEVLSAAHGWALNQAFVTEGTHPAPIAPQTRYFRGTGPGGANYLRFRATSGGADIDITGTTTGGTVALAQEGATVTRVFSAPMTAPAWVLNTTTGVLQLGNNPAGMVTADPQGQTFSGSYAATAGHAVRVLIGQGDPLVSTAVGVGSVLVNPVGVWLTEDANVGDMIDQLALGCASVWGVNRLGTLVATAPILGWGATEISTISENDFVPAVQPLVMERKLMPAALIATSALVAKNFTRQQPGDLSSLMSVANRELYGSEGTVVPSGLGYAISGPGDDTSGGERRTLPRFDTWLTDPYHPPIVYGNEVVTPWLQTGFFIVAVRWGALDALQVGRITRIKTARYGFDNTTGTKVLVIGVVEDVAAGVVTIRFMAPIAGYYPS